MGDCSEGRETVAHSGGPSANTSEFAWKIMILFNNSLGSRSGCNIRLPEDTELLLVRTEDQKEDVTEQNIKIKVCDNTLITQ